MRTSSALPRSTPRISRTDAAAQRDQNQIIDRIARALTRADTGDTQAIIQRAKSQKLVRGRVTASNLESQLRGLVGRYKPEFNKQLSAALQSLADYAAFQTISFNFRPTADELAQRRRDLDRLTR